MEHKKAHCGWFQVCSDLQVDSYCLVWPLETENRPVPENLRGMDV